MISPRYNPLPLSLYLSHSLSHSVSKTHTSKQINTAKYSHDVLGQREKGGHQPSKSLLKLSTHMQNKKKP